MKALIFAAGLGTRLRPLTDSLPKALVCADGIPMLQRVIEKLRKAGVEEMVINVHHFADKILEFLKANNDFGIKIQISDESDCLLETGGGILNARQWLDGEESFIVHNADVLTDFDLRSMIEAHESEGSDVTLLVDRRNSSRQFLFDSVMRLNGWTDLRNGEVKPSGLDVTSLNQLAFGGVHIIRPKRFFPTLDAFAKHRERAFSITPFYIESCRNLKITGYAPIEKYGWFDVGAVEKLRAAEDYIRQK